jgi:hypothetical protein
MSTASVSIFLLSPQTLVELNIFFALLPFFYTQNSMLRGYPIKIGWKRIEGNKRQNAFLSLRRPEENKENSLTQFKGIITFLHLNLILLLRALNVYRINEKTVMTIRL